jgi:predicted nucleotidyltransferase
MIILHSKEKILYFLLENRSESFSIREIAKRINIDYKAVFISLKELSKAGIINTKKLGNTIQCNLNYYLFHSAIIAIEYVRREALLRNKDIAILLERLKENINSPFFIILVFGSYASKRNKIGSDIDLMAISDDLAIIAEIRKTIKSLPINIHLATFSSQEFTSMLKTTEFNVGNEAVKNNIILSGIEDYYRILENVR